jgi:hypothetical protein
MFAPTQKTARPKPKTPGPIAQKTSQAAGDLFRVTWPYAASLLTAVVLAVITGQSWLLLLTCGAVLGIAGLKLHEGWGWHRKGGKAAARARRKYQGHASRREIAGRLSARAIRRRAHVTRPGTDRPRQLPANELGILIGTTVRRTR